MIYSANKPNIPTLTVAQTRDNRKLVLTIKFTVIDITSGALMSLGRAKLRATSARKGANRIRTHIIIAGVDTPRGIILFTAVTDPCSLDGREPLIPGQQSKQETAPDLHKIVDAMHHSRNTAAGQVQADEHPRVALAGLRVSLVSAVSGKKTPTRIQQQ